MEGETYHSKPGANNCRRRLENIRIDTLEYSVESSIECVNAIPSGELEKGSHGWKYIPAESFIS